MLYIYICITIGMLQYLLAVLRTINRIDRTVVRPVNAVY